MVPIHEKHYRKKSALFACGLCLYLFLFPCPTVSGQSVTKEFAKEPLKNILKEVEKQTGFSVIYEKKDVDEDKPVSASFATTPVEEVLVRILGENLDFSIQNKMIVIFRKKPQATTVQKTSPGDPATQSIVTGTVFDKTGAPLPGVNISVKGTTTGIISDINGKYTITVPNSEAVLVFSYVGFAAREVTADNRIIDVTLNEDTQTLDEVVVIGYGAVRKSDLTGSVASVKGKDLNSYPAPNIMQALSGRSPGVQVMQNTGAPGGTISIRVRGANSIQGNNEPLYVVDGFPINGNPTHLNNMDIESIEILKDASATAIYGSRGANGVVMITTKKGKSGKTEVEFTAGYSSQSVVKKLDLMNAREYALFYNLQQKNDTGKEFFTQEQIDGFGEGYDYQDMIFGTAPLYTTGLTVSGGNDKTRFSISGNIYAQEGIIKGSAYDRYSLRTDINHRMNKMFSISVSSIMSRLIREARDSGGGSRGNSMISAAISAPPTLDPYEEDGVSYRKLATAYPFVATDLINPLNFINEQKDRVRANVILTNVALLFNPIPELTVKILGGIENRDDTNGSYTTRNYINSPGRAGLSATQFTSLLNENTIGYNKTFNDKHDVAAIVGFTYQDFLSTYVSGSGSGFLSDVFEEYSLGSSSTPNVPGSGYSKSVLLSYLGRVNYGYDGKYLLTASLRRDGSSKYSKGNKWGYFPSAAVAWRVSGEDFLKENPVVSMLKLRASWGKTGSQAIGAYATLSTLSPGRTIFNDAMFNTFAPGTTLPGDLKWETTAQTDMGIDIGILNNRIHLTADYYIKNTSDLLNVVRLPTSMGYVSTIQNVGQIRNRGVDLGIDTRILTGSFQWDVNANISFNRNKVVKLYGGEDILGGSVNVVVINDNTSILREGRPVGQFWGYLEDGYDDNGKIVFKDLNEDGAITQDDKTYIGDPNPDFIYGINSNMRYKRFELTLFIQGVHGNDLFNASSISNTIDYGFGLNMPKEVYYNHWTPDNPNAKYPAITYNTTVRVSDRFIEDGSFMRLKNIQLTYDLPVKNRGMNWIDHLQLYVSGQNLLTLTNYSWWDPEVNSRGGSNSTSPGIDHNAYPSSKSYTVGFRVGF
jgi:TonB-linked SusC/RagA family outer membrane protein